MIINSERVESELSNILLRLVGFHTEMSFLGCIRHIMDSTGLQSLLELIYAPKAAVHMLSGKAIIRAVCGHFTVDAALEALMLGDVLGAPLPCLQNVNASDSNMPENMGTNEDVTSGDVTADSDLDEARTIYGKLVDGSMSPEEVCSADVLKRIKDQLPKHATSSKASSRTVALWVKYMEMVDVLRKYIRAERTGNWSLHLQAIHDMLPYLAASGHNLYTKSARIYLQEMAQLPSRYPDVQKQFNKGLHVFRRSDRFRAGLPSDLIIEQVLMRSMKTSGGFTRGRGMTEQQRAKWLLSMPACADVNQVMQEFTGVSYNTGEQNKDMTKTKQSRDLKDTLTALQKKDQVITFASKSAVRLDDETIQIDPQLLF